MSVLDKYNEVLHIEKDSLEEILRIHAKENNWDVPPNVKIIKEPGHDGGVNALFYWNLPLGL